MRKSLSFIPVFCLWLVLFIAACGGGGVEETGVQSHLAGTFTVDASVDSTMDYGGFEVTVVTQTEGDVDTLGYAITDSTGGFSMEVEAAERGVYALLVNRGEAMLAVGEIVVADGDSATVDAAFPLANRQLLVRSVENGAWMAYRNTKALHNQALVQMINAGGYNEADARRIVNQTTNVLWSLRGAYENTVGASVASAEAVVMLDGWDDSLLVARTRELAPDNPGIDEVVRIARRAEARLRGQEAGLALVREYQSFSEMGSPTWSALQSEIVIAHMDSLQDEQARAAVQTLVEGSPDSEWSSWADKAIYELENLRPGMQAPGFVATTNEGRSVSLDSLRGRLVILEFYDPENNIFQREYNLRNAVYEAIETRNAAIIAISLQPDSLVNEAFLEGRNVPGLHVYATDGVDDPLAQLYNVNILPTRYLIEWQGKIVSKYVGTAMQPLQTDLIQLFESESG